VASVDLDGAADGHHDMVAQPHSGDEGPIAEAEVTAAEISSDEQPMGTPGRKFNRLSPFYLGLTAAAGVAVTYGLVQVLVAVSSVLVLIGVAFFLAVGLEPAASWLVTRGLRRWMATTVVFVVFLAVTGAFVAAAIPPLAQQAGEFIHQIPQYLQQAQDHSSAIGRLNDRFHLQQRITDSINGSGSSALTEVVSAGTAIFGAVADFLIVIVLTVYFVIDMPRIRATIYRMVPHTRRPRAILIGDEMFAKVGAYVLGNVLISVITGIATFVWLLAIFVAILDLVPIVGSTIAGVVVAAVSLTVSPLVCIATIAFFIVFRFVEDYLLVPRIIGRTMKVPGLITVVAVLIGGALLGIVGALVAIPVAAALQLLTQEVLYPRLDEV
jgi:predicted PurR-regulated permease PerM